MKKSAKIAIVLLLILIVLITSKLIVCRNQEQNPNPNISNSSIVNNIIEEDISENKDIKIQEEKIENMKIIVNNETLNVKLENNSSAEALVEKLICTDGEGWYQEEGKEAQSLKPGDVITIPANVKHWHGAKKDSWFSHIAVEVPGEDTSTEWYEPVIDEEYDKL